MIDSDHGERVPLPKGNGLLKKLMMDNDGVIDSLSNYKSHIKSYNQQAQIFLSQNLFFQHCNTPKNNVSSLTHTIPDYYRKRPYLERFGKSLMQEVYDFAIQYGCEQIYNFIEFKSLNSEQREGLQHLIHLISYDFILKATGIFESCDFWLIEINNGSKIHISHTDPDNIDFERCELSYDMHDTTAEGMINVFSNYGSYNIT